MDPIVDHIEQQKQARHDLERDFPDRENRCPECGSEDIAVRTDEPGDYACCWTCNARWDEDNG